MNTNEFEAHGADTENAGQMFFAELLKTAKGDSEAYTEFVEKFKPKKTTDDCFTPPEIYEVIADWVSKEYGISRAAERAAAERAAATRWPLSPSERIVVESLGKHAHKNRRGFTFNPWQE